MIQRAIKLARSTATHLGLSLIKHARPLARWAMGLWSRHQEMIATKGSYLAAIAALAALLLNQTNPKDLLAAVITGVFAVYAATRRGIQRRGDDPLGWDRF